MKIVSPLVLGLLVLPLAAQEPAEAAASEEPAPKALKLGGKLEPKVMKEHPLPDIDGKKVVLGDFGGKITVVNFWATRCPIQQKWDPRLAEIVREYEEKGVRFLMINANGGNGEIVDKDLEEGQKPYQEIRRVLEEKNLPYRVLIDEGNFVADVFQARVTPHIYVFDQKGTLVYKGLIDDDMNGNPEKHYLADTLDQLLEGEEVEPSETRAQGCTIKRTVRDRKIEGAEKKKRRRR